ncbi:MAG: gliding motility-associated C-terminal domain-containing protein [Paraprevotella sp.]|nr:gliding motility-associated C-terminal domain-containing protein [Paraprevotella sp.]
MRYQNMIRSLLLASVCLLGTSGQAVCALPGVSVFSGLEESLPAHFIQSAQEGYPSVDPTAQYITTDGEELDDASSSQSAPLVAHFYANPENVGDYSVRYEWKIWREGDEERLLVHRFDEDIEYTFTSSGSFRVQLYATFVLGNDTIVYPSEGEENPISVSISESKLEFPNAFSPNGDGYNDVLRAKDGYQSIVSFEAAVFNRWGRKLYSWNSPAGEWDGKVNGRTVSDGVYFLVVKAKGADGRKYNVKKTISVLTGYDNSRQQGTGGTDE